MNVVIENRPRAVYFESLKEGDYFINWSGDLLYRKKNDDTAHLVTASWPMAEPEWFSPSDQVHRVEVTAIHVRVVG